MLHYHVVASWDMIEVFQYYIGLAKSSVGVAPCASSAEWCELPTREPPPQADHSDHDPDHSDHQNPDFDGK